MKRHPDETELALLAGGETNPLDRFLLMRHVRSCAGCRETMAEFEALRSELGRLDPPDLDWPALAAEMRANIRLGLEAGECVREAAPRRKWNPRLVAAFASLLLVVGASFVLRGPGASRARKTAPTTQIVESQAQESPVLAATEAGIELRTGPASSMTLLSRRGASATQTVSARGEIRSRYIDSETGAVTINNVYLQ